jgi:ATP-dependent DNA ligase
LLATGLASATGCKRLKAAAPQIAFVGGFRYATGSKMVGSLLLGLYDTEGLLHHVGFTSGIAGADRPGLTKKLERLVEGSRIYRKRPWWPKSLEWREEKGLATA